MSTNANFKLTPATKHYTTRHKRQGECALVKDSWVCAWDDGAITLHREDGVCMRHLKDGEEPLYRSMYHITAEFTGWLADPFEGYAGKKYAFIDSQGFEHRTATKPIVCANGDLELDTAKTRVSESRSDSGQYIGDWRNSLVERKE